MREKSLEFFQWICHLERRDCEKKMSSKNPYAAPSVIESTNRNKKVDEVEVSVVEDASSEVPSGSIKEVLDWVGEDVERASLALDVESKGSERKTLLQKLKDLIND